MAKFTNNPPRVAIADAQGNPTPEFYRWMSSVTRMTGADSGPFQSAQFLTLAVHDGLDAERVLTPVSGQLVGTDAGAGSTYTLGLADTVVTAAAYGSASSVTTFTVDQKGRVTAAATVPIAIAASQVTGANLTKADDTNVTLTLGGTATGSLLKAVSLTLGWTGTLAETRGGTGFSSYLAGDMIYAVNGTTLARLGVGLNNYVLTSNGTVPGWTASTGTGNVARATQPQFTNTIGVGTAAVNSGSGVSFPATQSPSTDANTLDDYEEGTWTPTVTPETGAITTYSASGYYTKIGRHVFCTAVVNITTNGTGAGGVFYTLPFTSGSSANWVGCGRETASTGSMLSVTLGAASGTASIKTYSNGYPGGSGYTLVVTLDYFV